MRDKMMRASSPRSQLRTALHATSDGATWEPVEIRGVQGCEWTNEAGLYFAKWTEGATNFKYSSFDITGVDAREMLADWDPLEQPPG